MLHSNQQCGMLASRLSWACGHSRRARGGAGGRCLFMGTDGGALRAYKLPLGPGFQEARCAAGAVSRMRLGHEDAQLFVASADGSLFVFDVRDRDPARGAGKRCGAAAPAARQAV